MDRNRILELAVEALEKQKAGIDAEIETVRAELKEAGSRTARKEKPAAVSTRRRGPRTPAERRAHSDRMKAYWADKKIRAAKASAKLSPASGKSRAKSAAEKKALSLKMKQVWEKRRAEAAKKAK